MPLRWAATAAHFEVETARALVERLGAAGRQSTAEMLQELRRAFPHSPLAVRVRALRRRSAQASEKPHIPR